MLCELCALWAIGLSSRKMKPSLHLSLSLSLSLALSLSLFAHQKNKVMQLTRTSESKLILKEIIVLMELTFQLSTPSIICIQKCSSHKIYTAENYSYYDARSPAFQSMDFLHWSVWGGGQTVTSSPVFAAIRMQLFLLPNHLLTLLRGAEANCQPLFDSLANLDEPRGTKPSLSDATAGRPTPYPGSAQPLSSPRWLPHSTTGGRYFQGSSQRW